MVDISIIKETIEELLSANVDKDTIFATLKDIGAELGDIEKCYRELTEPKEEIKKNESTTVVKATPQNENVVEKRATPQNENVVEKIQVEALTPSTTTEELEQATNEITDIEPETKNENPLVSKPQETIYLNQDNENIELIKKQIIEFDSMLSEIKAQLSGLTKIMRDILEENRNILNKLK